MTRVGVFSLANSLNYLTSPFVHGFPVFLVDRVTITAVPSPFEWRLVYP